MVYGVIEAAKAEISSLSSIGPTVFALWAAIFWRFGPKWPQQLMYKQPYLQNHWAKFVDIGVFAKRSSQGI
jgi:hypothetical protein